MAKIRMRVTMGSFFDKESQKIIRTGETFEGDKELLGVHDNLEVDGPVALPLSASKKNQTPEEPEDKEEETDEENGEGDDDTYTEDELKAIAAKYTLSQLKTKAKAQGITVKKSSTAYSLTVALLNAGVEL